MRQGFVGAIGDYCIDVTSDVTLVIDGNWQQKNPSGEEGVASWGTRIRTQNESLKSSQNTHISSSGAPKALPTLYPPMGVDANLQIVVNAWPNLPPAIRAGIMAMVQAAKGG